jgi:hypothetical protein
MMIKLMGRGFALLATVLSFIAGNRDIRESNDDWTAVARKFRPSSQTLAITQALSAFVTLT